MHQPTRRAPSHPRPVLTALAFLLLLALPALAQEALRISLKKHHRSAYQGRCVIDVSYPEVAGRPDLNAKIRTLFPAPIEPSLPGQTVDIDQDLKVTYNSKGLLSVYGDGLATNLEKGQMASAHPTKLFAGIILDAKTGKSYSLRDMFGQDAHQKLDGILAERAAKIADLDEVGPLDGHTYHCYLSKDGVTFYQIFDNFALGSVAVTIPYDEAKKLAGPTSPLSRF